MADSRVAQARIARLAQQKTILEQVVSEADSIVGDPTIGTSDKAAANGLKFSAQARLKTNRLAFLRALSEAAEELGS